MGPLKYMDFKNLFSELIGGAKVPESAALEYLRNSLDPKLAHILRGVRTKKEAWSRLDDHFADNVGAMRTIVRNLATVDLSKGSLFDKLDKLHNEIVHATYLLKEMKEKWVDWSSSAEEELVPGRNEWPAFLKWLLKERKAAMRDRWYGDAEVSRTSSLAPSKAPPAKSRTMDYLN